MVGQAEALEEEMLTALPTLGKIDFVYTAMEKKARTREISWTSVEVTQLSPGRSTNTLRREMCSLQRVLISLLSSFVPP